MRKYKIREISHNEIDVQTNGWSFGVIFGACVSGHYIAIPEWGVSVPAARADDTYYNRIKLGNCKNKFVEDSAEEIAAAIRDCFGEEN